MTLEQLSAKHPYYGTGTANEAYDSASSFLEAMGNADIDMNLCYRFDISKGEPDEEDEQKIVPVDGEKYTATIFTIQQRKGRIVEHTIEEVKPEEVDSLVAYLNTHKEYMKMLWEPLTF